MTGQTPMGLASPRYRPGPQRHVIAALSDRLRGGGACAVTGEPGGGRSALLAHVARSFTAGPVVTVRARAGECREPLTGIRSLCHAAGTTAVGAADPVRELVGGLRPRPRTGPFSCASTTPTCGTPPSDPHSADSPLTCPTGAVSPSC
ncbi:hypothetical protein [Streptomyces canarius]